MLRRHLFVSVLSFTCNFFAYFKFHSDWGRVISKIKQNELDCRDTAPLKRPVLLVGVSQTFFQLVVGWQQSFEKQIKHCSYQNDQTKLDKIQVLTRQRKRSTIFLFIAFCEYREQALLIVFLVHLSALICLL